MSGNDKTGFDRDIKFQKIRANIPSVVAEARRLFEDVAFGHLDLFSFVVFRYNMMFDFKKRSRLSNFVLNCAGVVYDDKASSISCETQNEKEKIFCYFLNDAIT